MTSAPDNAAEALPPPEDDLFQYCDETPIAPVVRADAGVQPWCVLLVDDDPEVHSVTRIALHGVVVEGRPLELVSAYSGAQGREVFESRSDIALAIVDVVMETPHAGLELVRFVRQDMRNHLTRLVMRTGQSGMMLEDHVIRDYEIDDYKEKTELTMQKLRTMLYSKLRGYRDICTIQAQREVEVRTLSAKLSSAQEYLIQSEKLASIGQLAAGVAHEINNPIGYIFSNYGTLENYLGGVFQMLEAYEKAEGFYSDPSVAKNIAIRKTELEIEFLKEDIPTLMRESKEGIVRVRKIVQDLKDFSHVDALQEWHYCDLNQGIESTLNVVNNEIKYKADVVRRFGALPEVHCMASQINQVVMNLLVNAAHAIGTQRGTITVETGMDGASVWFAVSDTGAGIPADVLPRIFDPFFTTKSVGKGTGLGLSLSYGIIQKHHGTIVVQTELGRGTTFRVTIPVSQPASDREEKESTA